MKIPLLKLPPNRVRRNYKGGRGLDALEGCAQPADGDCPENWIASLVEAANPGLPARENEGLAALELTGHRYLLRDLIARDPDFYLGPRHFAEHGLETGFLAKLLDSAMRLHIQAHPTREFARRHYGKPWGKFETYVILAVRPGVDPYILLGFQHSPTPEEWLRIVTEQDLPAMLACFEKVPVAAGEVWYVPGGLPHALGEGLTVLEVMEPSDLVVRCEFEREGMVVPPPARFMGREPAEALKIFDYTEWPLDRLQSTYRVQPHELLSTANFRESQLIGPRQIDCFEVRKLVAFHPAEYALDGRFRIGFVHRGRASLTAGGGQLHVRAGECFVVAAAADSLALKPEGEDALEIFFILPGAK